MNPIRQAITAAVTGPIIALNPYANPASISVGVDVSSAVGATYGVQYTFDDVVGYNTSQPGIGVASPLWRNDVNLGAGTTTSGTSAYTTPIMALRIVVSALTSGTIQVEVLQGMNAGQQG